MKKKNILESGKKRIFIVNDDLNFLHSLTFTLKRGGFQVITATNGKSAYEMIVNSENNEDLPDLLIVDMRIPGYTGKELISLLVSAQINIPVLLTTTQTYLVSEFVSGLKPDIKCQVLIKPFDSKELLKRIAEILQ
jgi:DNA-binding response OmpR family regulator